MGDWWPSIEEYTPGIDKQKWVELLKNPKIFDDDSLAIMKRMMDIGGAATCKQLSQKYGETITFYNFGSVRLARRLLKETNCNVLPSEKNENSKLWPILYQGKYADKQTEGIYIWQLRDELREALKEIDLSEIPLHTQNIDAGWWPSIGEYTPGIDKQKWLELLRNPEIFDTNSLAIMKRIIDSGGAALYKQLSHDYGETGTFYYGGSLLLAERIFQEVNCNLIPDKKRQLQFLVILYQTRFTRNRTSGIRFWLLRQELREALEEIDLSDVPLYSNTHLSEPFEEPPPYQRPPRPPPRVRARPKNRAVPTLSIPQVKKAIRELERMVKGKVSIAFKGLEQEKPALQTHDTETELSLMDLLTDTGSEISSPHTLYTESDFLKEVFIDPKRYATLKKLLGRKKNVILKGPPGVGKTFAAKRLAYSIMGEKGDDRVKVVQFHQSYSYEDFVMGYRPSENSFHLAEGPFYQFCETAVDDPERSYFFIIDEINRGNLSKIFGELLMLMEGDKRGEFYSIQLMYSKKKFSVPENLYIIGMMNTADRSLAMIDYALRRRFAFFDMEPAFDSKGFKEYQYSVKNPKFDSLITAIKELNSAIQSDKSLGAGFRIGHSYFCANDSNKVDYEWLSSIVEFELIPLLEEYWFDEPSKVEHWSDKLRDALHD